MKFSEAKENLQPKNCSKIGIITKSHGVGGQVSANLYVDLPLTKQSWIFIEFDNAFVPYKIEFQKCSFNDTNAIIKFEDLNTLESSKKLLKRSIYIPKKLLNKPNKMIIDVENFIIGFEIYDEHKKFLGTIVSFADDNKNPLFTIINGENDYLLPSNSIEIVEFDLQNSKIIAQVPDGIGDL